MSVVLAGKTYITVTELIALAPTHPLLDKIVTRYERRATLRRPAREDPEMLVARWIA